MKTTTKRAQVTAPGWLGRREKADVQRVMSANSVAESGLTQREIDLVADLISHRYRISSMQRALTALARSKAPDADKLAVLARQIDATAAAAREIAENLSIWAAE